MSQSACLADGGKHHWRYRMDSTRGKLRECLKCGRLEQQQGKGKRYKQIGSTRWRP